MYTKLEAITWLVNVPLARRDEWVDADMFGCVVMIVKSPEEKTFTEQELIDLVGDDIHPAYGFVAPEPLEPQCKYCRRYVPHGGECGGSTPTEEFCQMFEGEMPDPTDYYNPEC